LAPFVKEAGTEMQVSDLQTPIKTIKNNNKPVLIFSFLFPNKV